MHRPSEKISVTPLPGTQHPASGIQHPASSIRHPDHGFTLLEIMIAIFIFAIVVTTLFASYKSVLSGAETIDYGITSFKMAKNCLSRMILDLESAHISLPPEYAPPEFEDPPDAYRIIGDMFYAGTGSFPRLRFTSLQHISFGEKKENRIAEIVYYVQALEDGTYVLKRADSLYPYPPFEEKASDPILCEDVKTLQLKYYNQEGTEFELWDSDAADFGYATPRAIRIKLEIGKDSESRWFETMVTLPVYREKKE